MDTHSISNRLQEDIDREKASNAYLMSLVALMAGLPLPVLNLLASVIFSLLNRKGSYFVRWHCTQVLISQISVFFLNSFGFTWTMRIIFFDLSPSNEWIAYVILVLLVNLLEIIGTLVSAIRIRKGKESSWWLFGPITDQLVRKS